MNWPRLMGLLLALCLHGALLYALIERSGSGVGADGSGPDNFTVVAEVSLESADLFTQNKQDAAADANPVQAPPPPKEEEKIKPPEKAETDVPLETPRQEPPPEQAKPQMASVATQAQDEQQAAAALAARHDELYSKYSAQVTLALERYKVEKTRRAKESDALLQFTVAPSGQLLDRAVIQSSGNPMLDSAAITSVERAAPFPPFPPELSSGPLTFTVPFQFRKH